MAERKPVHIETGEISPRTIAIFAAGWFVFVLLAMGLFSLLVGRAEPIPQPPAGKFFPYPRLVTKPYSEFPSYRAAQHKRLTTYGWADKARGVAHIPIQRAMDEIAKQPDPYAPLATLGSGGTP